MTTVVYHRETKTLAADRRVCTESDIIMEPRTKIGREGGNLYGVSGKASAMAVVAKWIRTGRPDEGAGPQMKGSDAVIIYSDGRVVILFGEDPPLEVDEPFTVLGSGRAHAITACDMGAGAVKAVEMAIRRDLASGDGVNSLILGGD